MCLVALSDAPSNSKNNVIPVHIVHEPQSIIAFELGINALLEFHIIYIILITKHGN